MTVQNSFYPLSGPRWFQPIQFFSRIAVWQRGLVSAATITVLLLGVVEGLGLSLIVPLFGLMGMDTGQEASGPAKAMVDLFRLIGLPLSPTSIVIAFLVLGLSQTILHAVQQYLIILTSERVTVALRESIFDGMSRANWPFILNEKDGRITNAIISEASRIGIVYGNAVTVLGLIVIFIVYASVAAWVSWQFTLAICLVGAISTIIMRRLFISSRRFGEFSSRANTHMQEMLNEHLRAAKLLRLMNANSMSCQNFSKSLRGVHEYSRRNQLNTVIVKVAAEPQALIFMVIIIYLSITYSLLSGPEIILLLGAFYRLAPRIVFLQQLLQRVVAVLPAYEMMSNTLTSLTAAAERTGGVLFQGLADGIVVKNLYVEANSRTVISNVSLTIPARKTTAIVGPSGSGKTTLIDVIFNMRTADKGEVLFDDLPLNKLDISSLRSKIGFVSQECQFFNDSIETNLRLVKPDASDQEIWEALTTAHADDFVRGQSLGLRALVGKDGMRLSGGQRQRLSLARALLSKPDILILDEPTSALDKETSELLNEGLRELRGSITIILITHDLDMERLADVVYKIDLNGECKMKGTE